MILGVAQAGLKHTIGSHLKEACSYHRALITVGLRPSVRRVRRANVALFSHSALLMLTRSHQRLRLLEFPRAHPQPRHRHPRPLSHR